MLCSFFFHFAFLDTSIISINPGFYWPVSPSCQVPYPVRALQNILFSLNILSADGPDLNSTGRARNESTQLLSNRCVQGRNKIECELKKNVNKQARQQTSADLCATGNGKGTNKTIYTVGPE